MNKIFLLVALAVIFSGCKKEEVEIIKEVEKQYTWKSLENFQLENAIQLNSFANQSTLYTLGPTTFTHKLPEGQINRFGANVAHHNLQDELSTRYKFPITDDYFVTFSEKDPSKLRVRANANPITYTSGRPTFLTVSMPFIDPLFNRFLFLNYSNAESFAINSRGQTLAVYGSTELASQVKALLLDVVTYGITTVFADTVRTKVVRFPGAPQSMVGLQSVGENFYFSPYYTETYCITPSGQQTKVLNNGLLDIFEQNQIMFGISYDGKGYTSTDNGLTWQARFEMPSVMTDLTYTKVSGKVIGFFQSQIFQIMPSISDIRMKELDNYGLAGKKITSVKEFDGKVYVTTLSGVFYKDSKDLFVAKEVSN